MISAAPVIRKPISVIGAPGLTDFTSIYIACELNAREYRTTFRHECAHVWSGHNRRRPKVCIDKTWKIACEMEIARNIYDAEDIDTIEYPRSRLTGGYLPNTIEGMPANLMLAEDIYDWLLLNPEKEHPEIATCKCDCSKDSEEGNSENLVTMSEIREKLDEVEYEQKSAIAAKTSYTAILNRPPSLIECIDAALRYRISRESTYRRPSRRPCSDIVLKGKLSIPRPPLIEIFIDRSGSFNAQKTAMAEQALSSIISRYGASIRCDTWFFGNGKLSDKDVPGGGDTPYRLVARQIGSSRPKIAVIITDDDPVGEVCPAPIGVSVICIPIGCNRTNISAAIKGVDVAVIR